jgi:hypothetical protein
MASDSNKINLYILGVATVSMVFNVGYIIHELGLFPHTKDRKNPTDRRFPHRSFYDKDRQETHKFTATSPLTIELRKVGHRDVYNFNDPVEALQNVIRRYEEEPSRSRYDDLFNLSNFISNNVRSDERINQLIQQATDLPFSKPYNNRL